MQHKHLAAVALAQLGAAQSNQTLAEALASQNASLSTLNSILAAQPGIVSALSNATNITILAPNNDAFSNFLNGSGASADSGTVAALLTYHVINGAYYANDILALNGTQVFPTLLTNETYANVTGGQRVGVSGSGSGVTIYSGLGTKSSVVTPNVNFTGGTIHIIDHVLTIPPSDSALLSAGNLTALAGALTQANLGPTVNGLKDVTIFAPTNAAFSAIGNVVANLTTEDLASILKYHLVQGQVIYAQDIKNGQTVQALDKGNLKFTIESDGSVFVDGAKVVATNNFAANGVVHLIDNVLNPNNASATPSPSATSGSPAFGPPAPTGTSPGHLPSGAAMPMGPGALHAAVLFGGVAMLANM